MKKAKREKGIYIKVSFAGGSREDMIRLPFSAFPKRESLIITTELFRRKLYRYEGLVFMHHFDALKQIKEKQWLTLDRIQLEYEGRK